MPNAVVADSEGTEGNKRISCLRSRIFRSRIGRAVFLSSAFLSVIGTGTLQVRTEESVSSAGNVSASESSLPLADRIAERLRFVPEGPRTSRLSRENRIVTTAESEVSAFADGIRDIVSGYPIEEMAEEIARYDREVAALIVGIAKKESDWGRRSPSDAEGDCFNYWGYKGVGGRGTATGYACFGSRKEAVRAVGGRIGELVAAREASDPERLVVWKCGSSCAGHDPEGVRKWIADVRLYYEKVMRG